MDIYTLAIILALGLIGVLIFYLFIERKMQRETTSKSKYKNASLLAFGCGVFTFFLAIISLAFQSTYKDILAHRFLGTYGIIGFLVLIGIALFIRAKSLKQKSEQEKKDK